MRVVDGGPLQHPLYQSNCSKIGQPLASVYFPRASCARDVHTGEELSIAKMINAPIDGPHGIECDDGCRAPVFTGQQVASTSRSTTTL